jgi:hypothetical protein
MGNGQIDNKFAAQRRRSTRADLNVSFGQFCHHFLFTAMPDIEGLADINQYIVAEVGTGRYKVAQLLTTMLTTALAAYQNYFTRIKPAYV